LTTQHLLIFAAWAVGGSAEAAPAASFLRGAAIAWGRAASECGSGALDSYWDYTDGGASWNIGQCCAGKGQSPLNLTAVSEVHADGNTLFWGYTTVERPVTMRNTGRILSAKLDDDTGGLFFGAQFPKVLVDLYSVWKVEIHTPSEHTFGGRQVPLELQVFHRRRGVVDDAPPPEDIAVLSFGFVGGGQPSTFLDALRQGGLPEQAGAEKWVNTDAPAALDFAELFGPGKSGSPAGSFWEYTGSLTTPPCSHGVRWFVRPDALVAFPATVNEFKKAVTAITPVAQKQVGNARALQPACGAAKLPREVRDVSDKLDTGLKPSPDVKFKSAASKAARKNREFERSLATPPPLYENCLARLAEASRQLVAARAREKRTCAEVEVERTKLRTSGDGLQRLAAGQRLNGRKAVCKQSAKVIRALTAELVGGEDRCAKLKPSSSSSLFGASWGR